MSPNRKVERVKVYCFICDKEKEIRIRQFEKSITKRFFCSIECRNKVSAKIASEKPTRICAWCKQEYKPANVHINITFCKKACESAWQSRNSVHLQCYICSKDFSLGPSTYAKRIKNGLTNLCCSVICRDKYKRQQAYGKKRKNKGGYIVVFLPDHPNSSVRGFIGEHRLIMEEIIGRPLLSKEEVHHKNGVRDDNRKENLELWSYSQPRGQRIVDKLVWARELIDLYGSIEDKLTYSKFPRREK